MGGLDAMAPWLAKFWCILDDYYHDICGVSLEQRRCGDDVARGMEGV